LLAFAGWWLWENELRPRHPVGPTVRIATWNLGSFPSPPRVDLRAIADSSSIATASQNISSGRVFAVALDLLNRDDVEVRD